MDTRHRIRWGQLLVAVMLMLAGTASGASTGLQEVRITIRARAFVPAHVAVQVGAPVRLIFDNEDVEIHAFVPEGLFGNLPVDVSGTGAPFYRRGRLVRLLIGGGGQAALQFTPQRPGLYRYECDMPGHQMAGHILVQGSGPHGETRPQSGIDTQTNQKKG